MQQRNEQKMSSIVRRLHWAFLRKKIGHELLFDVLLFFVALGVWTLFQEQEHMGHLVWEYKRRVVGWGSIRNLTYLVLDENGTHLYSLEIYPMLQILKRIMTGILVVQVFNLLVSYHLEDRKIRKILAPINEMALRVEELSKQTFSADKYQTIEEAISQIEPKELEKLSFGDEDLQGIEMAMNNLLQRMQENYRQQTRFVNDASHELRTPIAVIEGYVNMLARWGKEDEQVLEEAINALQRESGHMKKLVEQLLFLARGDSGKNHLDIKEMSLKECMQEIYEESLLIDEQHIYRFAEAEDICIQGDPEMLKQAVRILVDNAAKYTNENDEILLSIGTNQEGRPYLQVQDMGIGMASADVAHMFERFYRADDVRKQKGTGLGLSIAKWIVDKHGGHFEILSRTELGTRVRIVL